MLSKKQIWRRTSPSQRKQFDLDLLFENSINYPNSNRAVALTHRDSVAITLRKARDDKPRSTESQKRTRTVRFSQYVEVCLIPTRSELFLFSKDLYWTLSDCTAFKQEATEEIKLFCKSNIVSVRQAIFNLYQPEAENLPLASAISIADEPESLSSSVISDEILNGIVALDIVPHESPTSTIPICTAECNVLEQPINNIVEEVIVKFNKTDVELSKKESESADSNESTRLRNSPRDKVIWERKWSRDKVKLAGSTIATSIPVTAQ